MKRLAAWGVIASLLLAGCVSTEHSKIEEARAMIRENKAECVLVKDGRIYAQGRGHGVSPLMELYETRRGDMAGGIIVDKVIGRAAASIAICGKVKHVHGEVMSEDAVAFLKKNGITESHTLLVPRILNRKHDGLCPLEQSVLGIDDPAAALASLKKKIASFQTTAQKKEK